MAAEDVTLTTRDGVALAGRFFGAGSSAPVVVIAGATGVAQRHYARFAEFLQSSGVSALSFDFRGVGGSRRRPLRGDPASFVDWATVDVAAAVDWALGRGPTFVVGHSLGGQGFGALERVNEAKGLIAFGVGAGWTGFMPAKDRALANVFFYGLGPLALAATDHIPAWLWGGEALPKNVFLQWRRFCNTPRYWFDLPELGMAAKFERVTVPVLAINATDDEYAPKVSAQAFFAHYPRTPVEFETPAPPPGRRTLGHMGYFRAGLGEPLWERVLARVREHA